MKRRKKARIIDASPIQESRLNIDDDKVQRFMADTEALLRDVPAHFVFNIDETGINDYAIAKKKQVLVHAEFPGERTQYPVERSAKSSTLVACIAADGSAVPPLLVVKHRTYRQALLLKGWAEEKVSLAFNESGFVNGDIFLR